MSSKDVELYELWCSEKEGSYTLLKKADTQSTNVLEEDALVI